MASIFSENWHLVAHLKPRLRRHASIHRHLYRDRVWYLLRDQTSGQFHRFSPEAYQVIGLLDGRRSLQSVWDIACERLGDDMPSQDEVIELLAKLHRANALNTEVAPDIERLSDRREQMRRQKRLKQWASPFGIRIPLYDPDKLLQRTGLLGRLLYNRVSALIAVLLFTYALSILPLHWQELTDNLSDRLLAPSGLLLMALVYPLIKLVHEFAHAYAVQRFGGTVHEMGVMLLVFFPVPYVDASSANAFANKWQRMLVGASGIFAELVLAACALWVWSEVEPGPVRAIAYYVVLTAGISSILFNGNPLLRFDAYYVLADWLEIPNLAQRANRQLGYLARRYLLRLPHQQTAAHGVREALWLGGYGAAAFIYRILVFIAIALFIAESYLFVGIVLIVWAGMTTLLLPAVRNLYRTWRDPQVKRYHGRIAGIGAVFVLMLFLLIGVIPFPHSSYTQGVTWVDERDRLRAATDGFIVEVLRQSGEHVEAGTAVVQLQRPLLGTELKLAEAQLAEAEARHTASLDNTAEQMILQEEIAQLREEVARYRERLDELRVRAPTAGRLVLSHDARLPGNYLQRGELLGYLHDPLRMTIRTVVHEDDIALLRAGETAVEVRFASRPQRRYSARLISVTPQGDTHLPSVVLTREGGGEISRDTREREKIQSLESYFSADLTLERVAMPLIEERVHILLQHPPEALYARWYRDLRRLFLSRFDV